MQYWPWLGAWLLLNFSFIAQPAELDEARQLFRRVRAVQESTTYQAILDEGRADAFQRALLRWGRKHLGDPSAEIIAAVKAIDDVDRLERLGDHLGKVSSWQQLLAVP